MAAIAHPLELQQVQVVPHEMWSGEKPGLLVHLGVLDEEVTDAADEFGRTTNGVEWMLWRLVLP